MRTFMAVVAVGIIFSGCYAKKAVLDVWQPGDTYTVEETSANYMKITHKTINSENSLPFFEYMRGECLSWVSGQIWEKIPDCSK